MPLFDAMTSQSSKQKRIEFSLKNDNASASRLGQDKLKHACYLNPPLIYACWMAIYLVETYPSDSSSRLVFSMVVGYILIEGVILFINFKIRNHF
jgi:hypothetical protein